MKRLRPAVVAPLRQRRALCLRPRNAVHETPAASFVTFALNVLDDLHASPAPGARVLDFGCGSGGTVTELDRLGFDAYGCDISLDSPTERLRLIPQPYRLPFEDEAFDLVVSDQVFEHVMDQRTAFR